MFTGIGIARIFALLAIPILSRLYEISAFGTLAVYIAIVMIGKIMVNGGYEASIVLPEKDIEARALFKLCVKINWLLFGVILLLCLLVFQFFPSGKIILILGNSLWLLAIPISILLEGKSMALKYWLNRKKTYSGIANSMVAQTATTVSIQILLGVLGYKWNGLILGFILGELVSTICMVYYAKFEKLIIPKELITKMALNYRTFLKYGVIGGWANALAGNIPYLLFQQSFGATMNGHFSMANQKILAAPTSLIAAAVSPVYFRTAKDKALKSDGSLARLTWQMNKVLASMILPLTVLFMIWGPQVFSVVLGAEWALAGVYARWLAPFMFIRFIVHPLSFLIDVRMKLKQQLYFNLLYLFAILFIFVYCSQVAPAIDVIKCFAVVSSLLYLGYFVYLMGLSEDNE